MDSDTYYRDHWVEIDSDRLDAYEAMFAWHPRMAPLLKNAELEMGQRVLDFGCGPGGLAMELVRRVGVAGEVVGVDLNHDMIARAQATAAAEGADANARFIQLSDDRLPFDDGYFDRVVCKSVLEYVTSPAANIAEFKRVTAPGGRVHVIDSDWGMFVAEPWSDEEAAEVFAAASMAYHTPRIGRRLFGLFSAAGLTDVSVQILSAADTTGVRAPIARHMLSYGVESGDLSAARAQALSAKIDAGIARGEYLLVLPQFIVTGTVAG